MSGKINRGVDTKSSPLCFLLWGDESVSVHLWSIIKFHALLRGNSSSGYTTGRNRKWYRCESCTFVWNCMWQCNFHLKWCAHLAHHLIFTYDWKRFSSLHRSHFTWIPWPIGSCHHSAKCGRNGMPVKPLCGGLSVSCLWHDICLCHLSGTKTRLSRNNSQYNGHFRKKKTTFEVNNRSHLLAWIHGQNLPFISPYRVWSVEERWHDSILLSTKYQQINYNDNDRWLIIASSRDDSGEKKYRYRIICAVMRSLYSMKPVI